MISINLMVLSIF